MKIVQHFAMLNRQAMMDEIVKGMKLHVEEQFTTIHNYIDTDAMILRKGAVSAKAASSCSFPSICGTGACSVSARATRSGTARPPRAGRS